MLPIPPARYAGTERIVAALVSGLHRRGHRVTLFAPGDSQVDCELVPSVRRSLWSSGYRGDLSAYLNLTLAKAMSKSGDFDIIHSHLDTMGLPFARWCPTPVVSTLHGCVDGMGHPTLLDEFLDVPLVAISESQRRWSPRATLGGHRPSRTRSLWRAVPISCRWLSRVRWSHRPGEGRRGCRCPSEGDRVVPSDRCQGLRSTGARSCRRSRRSCDRRGRRRVPR